MTRPTNHRIDPLAGVERLTSSQQDALNRRVAKERRERELQRLGRATTPGPLKHIADREAKAHKLDPEARLQRRQDNREMRQSREIHRGARKHGQRTKPKGSKPLPWKADAKAKTKAKRQAA